MTGAWKVPRVRLGALMADVTASVIIITHNEGEMLGRTVDSVLASLPAGGEIVVVDDLSEDGSTMGLEERDPRLRLLRPAERLGAARARNAGADAAKGDVLVFSDAHVLVPAGWLEPLARALAQPGVAAVGPVISSLEEPEKKGYGFQWVDAALTVSWLPRQGETPYAVPMLGAGFLAARADVFRSLGGFDAGMIVWGVEDGELCLRLWSMGHECRLVPEVEVQHLFRSTHPYPVGWVPVLHNTLRTAAVHFDRARTEKVISAAVTKQAFPEALARLLESDVLDRRAEVRRRRKRDDGWFFERFPAGW
ncbi:MAG TPA: glycosyltransferase [Armatimonadota bacterium]|nr:glycosyltransferase [Armatimonadota bacterium]